MEAKKLWDWLKNCYIFQNLVKKLNALKKPHSIRHSECKKVIKYTSCIKKVFIKIANLKITISEAVFIHILTKLNSTFCHQKIIYQNCQFKDYHFQSGVYSYSNQTHLDFLFLFCNFTQSYLSKKKAPNHKQTGKSFGKG